jgi:hypothetical protein
MIQGFKAEFNCLEILQRGVILWGILELDSTFTILFKEDSEKYNSCFNPDLPKGHLWMTFKM